jgi:hypothetical protein
MVVPQDSATLGYPSEGRYPLNGDHLTIVKFGSKEDGNYRTILSELQELVRELASRSSVAAGLNTS